MVFMTILFNICSILAAAICLFVGIHLRKSEQRSKIEVFKYYSIGFFFSALAFFFLFLPGSIVFDPFWVQITFLLTDLLFLAAVTFFGLGIIPFWEKLVRFKNYFYWLFIFWAIIYLILNIVFFSPATPLKENGVTYYWQVGVPWLQNINRLLLVFNTFLLAVLFSRGIKTFKERKILLKSLLLSLAALTVSIAGFLFWFFPFFYFSPTLLILSGVLCLFGLSLGVIAIIRFKVREEPFVKKVV